MKMFGYQSIIGFLALALAACSGDSDADQAEPEYQHQVLGLTVEQVDHYQVQRQFAGLVVPRQSTDIGFELSGETAQILLDEGDRVEPGQLLAELDTRLLDAERSQLRAQQRDLAAQLELNDANQARQRDLKTRGFAADQRIDELTAERDSLRANQARLDAALAGNQVRLDKSRLVAPFAGTVSRRFVDQGSVVANGQAVFRLLESASMEVRVGIPARLVGAVKPGDSVQVWSANQDWPGTVLAVGSDVTRATLTVPVRVSLPDDAAVVAGDQAYLYLPERVDAIGFWVPMEALTDGLRGLWNVYVLQPATNASLHQLEARDVQIAYADNQSAYITGALANGERIVATGLQRLVPGQTVRLRTEQVSMREPIDGVNDAR